MNFKEKDLKILQLLKEDSKRTVKEIARELDTPPSTVHDRIQKMNSEGLIKQWTIVPDYAMMGKPITAFVLAKYVHAEGRSQRKVAEEIAKLENVHEVHIVTGTWDLLIKARVSSVEELSNLTVDKLSEMKGVGERVTITSLSKAKEER